MKPESSLPCTQQPVTAICPELDDCRPQPHMHFSKINFSSCSQQRLAVMFCPTRATYHTYFIILTKLYEKAEMNKFPLCNSLYPSPVFSARNSDPCLFVKCQVPRMFNATYTIRVVCISVPAVLNDWMVSVNFNMKVIFVRYCRQCFIFQGVPLEHDTTNSFTVLSHQSC